MKKRILLQKHGWVWFFWSSEDKYARLKELGVLTQPRRRRNPSLFFSLGVFTECRSSAGWDNLSNVGRFKAETAQRQPEAGGTGWNSRNRLHQSPTNQTGRSWMSGRFLTGVIRVKPLASVPPFHRPETRTLRRINVLHPFRTIRWSIISSRKERETKSFKQFGPQIPSFYFNWSLINQSDWSVWSITLIDQTLINQTDQSDSGGSIIRRFSTSSIECSLNLTFRFGWRTFWSHFRYRKSFDWIRFKK